VKSHLRQHIAFDGDCLKRPVRRVRHVTYPPTTTAAEQQPSSVDPNALPILVDDGKPPPVFVNPLRCGFCRVNRCFVSVASRMRHERQMHWREARRMAAADGKRVSNVSPLPATHTDVAHVTSAANSQPVVRRSHRLLVNSDVKAIVLCKGRNITDKFRYPNAPSASSSGRPQLTLLPQLSSSSVDEVDMKPDVKPADAASTTESSEMSMVIQSIENGGACSPSMTSEDARTYTLTSADAQASSMTVSEYHTAKRAATASLLMAARRKRIESVRVCPHGCGQRFEGPLVDDLMKNHTYFTCTTLRTKKGAV